MIRVVTLLAWRNLWRNHRRTTIMLMAISVGVWAMIFMTALTRGMVDQMITDGVKALPGHVQMHNPNYLDDPSITNLIPLSDEALAEKFDNAGFKAWASRVRVPAVITSERDSRGVTLLAIDPVAERQMSFVDYDEVEGRFLENSEDQGIVIGRKLANTLETEVGKRVVIMSQDPNNEIADRGLRVVGLFTASTGAVEEAYVFMGKKTAQKMLGVAGATTEVAFLGDDYRDVEPVYEAVMREIDGTVDVNRWYDVNTYLGSMMKVMDGFVLVWVVVIFLALSGYALTTKKDFSFIGGFLFAGILVAFVAGIAAMIFSMPGLSLAVSAMFVLLMCGLILYQTGQIVNGGETNYILATTTLYVSLYNLFTSLLHLLAAFSGDD